MSHQTTKSSKLNGSLEVESRVSPVSSQSPESEVTPRATRRRFSTSYKLRILSQADRCTKKGEIGALLRGEGLYSSHLSTWRTQRDQGELGNKKLGRPAGDPSEKEMAHLRRENERLQAKLDKAEIIIDVQKKLSSLLGLDTKTTE
jgi:transposase